MADKQIQVEIVTKADLNAIDELSDKITELKASAEDAINLDSLTSAFEEATSEVERLEEALDEAHFNGDDIEADIIADELAEARDKAEELAEQLEEVSSVDVDSTGLDELAESAEEASESVDELKDSIDGIDGSNASDAAGAFDEIGDSAGSATGEVDGLQASMDMIEASAMIGVASELSSLGSNAEGMAQEMNTAAISVGQLATNVGMAEPQMVSLINNISNATFPNNEAMAYVQTLNQMGVSAGQLGDAATNMDRINDATGIGYQKTMQLTQGLQAVGISADNLPESFNAIAYAQANVNGGADTLSQVLKTQAATINEYGLNVDQLVLIMQKLSEQGVQGRKMGSELSKMLKETNGDVSALEQSLGLEAGALSNASNATGAYTGKLQDLADEEAEHKTIVDQLGAAWEDFSLSMSPVLSPLSSLMGIIGQAGSYAVGINGIVQLANSMKGLSIVSSITGAFSSLWGVIIANPIILVVVAIAALVAALVWAYYNVDWFREMVDNAFATLQQFASGIYNSIAGAIQWLGDLFNDFTSQLGLNTSDWTQAILGFILFIPQLPMRVGQLLVDTLAQALGFGPNFTNTMIQSATDAVNGFVDKFWEIVNYVQTILQNVADYILSVGGLLSTNVDITGNGIIDSVLRVILFMLTLPGQIGMIFVNLIAQALGFGENFSQNMIKSAMDSVNGFVSYISQLPGKAWSYLSNMISRALTFASNFVNNIKQGAINAVNGFVSWISTLPGRLKEELDKMLEMASNFAMEIANRLTGGAAGMVVGWITGSGEHSPGYMYDALIGELQAMANAPVEYLVNLIGGIAGFASDMVNTLTEGLLGMDLETVFNTILAPLTDLETTIQGFIDYILTLGGLIPENADITGNSVIDTIIRVLGFVATLPLQIGMYLTDTLMQALGFGPNFTQTILSSAWNAVSGFISYIANLPGQLAGYLNNTLSHAISFASSLPGKLINGATQAVNGFISKIRELPGMIQTEFSRIESIVSNFVTSLPSRVWDLGASVVSALKSALGIGSPGHMYYMVEGELKRIDKLPDVMSTDITDGFGKLGSSIVDEFGNPKLLLDYDMTANSELGQLADGSYGNTTVNLNLEIGSVDSDDRVLEIVEAVRKELNWNNILAGRTVDLE